MHRLDFDTTWFAPPFVYPVTPGHPTCQPWLTGWRVTQKLDEWEPNLALGADVDAVHTRLFPNPTMGLVDGILH